jgi:hypothetical protein
VASASGYRVYRSQVIWRRSAVTPSYLALAFRPAAADPLAPFADRSKGPLTLTPEALEEWFERLTVRDMRSWSAFLRARRGAPRDSLAAFPALAQEPWYRPSSSYRDERLSKDEKRLLGRIEERLAAWRRAQVPTDSI